MLTAMDFGWAVGMFEGEGCINASKTRHGRVELALTSTDQDTADRFCEIMGGKVYGPYDQVKPHHKPYYQWTVTGPDAVLLLQVMLPYLHSRRTEVGSSALAAYAERVERKRYCKRGHPRSGNTNQFRQCVPCKAEAQRRYRQKASA